MVKEDLRVKKTKKAIFDALMELVMEKGYSSVSITDIVKKADINRNTFYLHYSSKEDLIVKMFEDASAKMNEALGTFVYFNSYKIEEIKEIQICVGVRNLLKYVKEKIEFYRVIIKDHSLQKYLEDSFNKSKEYISKYLCISDMKTNIVFEYAYNGMMGIFKQWILYEQTSIVSTAKIVAKLSYANLCQINEIKSLQKQNIN